jgi:hypothetical protein
MQRKVLYGSFFVVLAAVVLWYASDHVRLPEVTFQQSAQNDDHKKRMSVVGTVVDGGVRAEDGIVLFMMVDKEGTQSEVEFDQPTEFTAGQLKSAADKDREITVVGHMCGGHFKAADVMLPAY